MKLRGVEFVKEVGFKPGMKEREGVIDLRCESEEEEVMSEGIVSKKWKNGTKMRLTKRKRELNENDNALRVVVGREDKTLEVVLTRTDSRESTD